MAEATLNDISLQLKEQNKGEKKQTVVLQEIAKSVAGPSASQQAELDQEKKPTAAGGGGGAFGGGALKGIMGMFKSIGGFIRKLKAGLLFLLLPAVLTFINSEHFQKAISFIQDTLMPALKSIWEWLKLLFADPKAALIKLWDGIREGAADVGTWLWNSAIVPFWDWLTGIWKEINWLNTWNSIWEGAKSIGQWLWDKAIVPIKEWIVKIWKEIDWGKTWDSLWSSAASIGQWLWDRALVPIYNWIKDIWKEIDWGKTWDSLWSSATSIGQWLWDRAILPFWNWIKDIFVSINWLNAWNGLWEGASTIGNWVWNKAILPFWNWIKDVFVAIDWKQSFKDLFGAAVSIGQWIWNKAIKPFWTWISGVFSPEGGWAAYFLGLWNDLTDKAKDVGSWIWDHTIGPIWDWISNLFTFKKPADPNEGGPPGQQEKSGVRGFLDQFLIQPIWAWFKGLFDFSSWSAGLISAARILFAPQVFLLDNVITPIWNWFKGLFGWGDDEEEKANKDDRATSVKLFEFVLNLPGKIWAWLKKTVLGWFGLTPETESADMSVDLTGDAKSWSLSNLVGGVIGKLMGFFNNMMDFDLGEMTKKLPGYDTFKEVTGWFDRSNLPNTGPPGRDNPYVPTAAPKASGHPVVAAREAQIRRDMPESRKERMAELQSSIYRQQLKIDKSIAGTLPRGRLPFKRDQAIADVQKMQAELSQLQTAQMKVDAEAARMAAVLLNSYNQGPPSISSTNVSINAPSNSTTTAVSNVSESLQGASDPYVAIGGGR